MKNHAKHIGIIAVIVCIAALLLAGCQTYKATDYMRWGDRGFEQGEYDLAIWSYNQLLEEYPNSPLAEKAKAKIAEAQKMKGTTAQAQQTNVPAKAAGKTENNIPTTGAVAQQNDRAIDFVRVEGGTFQMGSNNGEDDEKPVHTVTVSSFSIGKYEVTQKEWYEVMGTTIRQLDDIPEFMLVGEGDNYPMYYVNWYDAVEYCNKRSEKEGLTPAYTIDKGRRDPNNTHENDNIKWTVTWNQNANGYRLPTEAEWEYAARGGNGSPGNYTYSGSNSIGDVAWYSGNTRLGYNRIDTRPVGTKAANSLGIHDMSGNVEEWCWDWYGRSYTKDSQSNPTGPASGSFRVKRGGNWARGDYLSSTSRGGHVPNFRLEWIGFRLVRN